MKKNTNESNSKNRFKFIERVKNIMFGLKTKILKAKKQNLTEQEQRNANKIASFSASKKGKTYRISKLYKSASVKTKVIIGSFISLIALITLAVYVFASNTLNINFFEYPNIDIVITKGTTTTDLSSFGDKIKEAIKNDGIDPNKVNVQSIKIDDFIAQDTAEWKEDIDSEKIGTISKEDNDSTFKLVGNSRNEGTNVMYYNTTQDVDQTFTFDYNIDFGDSFNSAGMILNGTQSGSTLSGYLLSFNNYSWMNDSKNTNNYNAALWKFSYKIGSHAFQSRTYVDGFNVDKSGTLKVRVQNAYIEITGGGLQDKKSITLDTKYGKYYGFFSNHYAHGCSKLGSVEFTNFKVDKEKVKSLKGALTQPQWRDNTLRIVVYVSDEKNDNASFTTAKDATQETAAILERLMNKQAYLVAWGKKDVTSSDLDKLIGKCKDENGDSFGTYIENTEYQKSINDTADYIKSLIKYKKYSKILVANEPIDVASDQEYLKTTSTKDSQNTEGMWKIDHDYTSIENNEGQYEKSGLMQDTLPVDFTKPGTYKISYGDTVIEDKIVMDRRPIARFTINQERTKLDASESYDPDHKTDSDKGIKNYIWEIATVTDTGVTWSKIPQSDGLKIIENPTLDQPNMLIKLVVEDEEGIKSEPIIRQITTDESLNVKPIADFTLETDKLYIGKKLSILDNSYDPKGRQFAATGGKTWTIINQEGNKVYEGDNPVLDYNRDTNHDVEEGLIGPGKYQISLKVKTTDNIESDEFTRTFEVTEDVTAPVFTVDKTNGKSDNSPIKVILRFSDNESGVKNFKYLINDNPEKINKEDDLYDEFEEGQLGGDNRGVVTINRSEYSVQYLHIISEDNKGNVSEDRVLGAYIVNLKYNFKIHVFEDANHSNPIQQVVFKVIARDESGNDISLNDGQTEFTSDEYGYIDLGDINLKADKISLSIQLKSVRNGYKMKGSNSRYLTFGLTDELQLALDRSFSTLENVTINPSIDDSGLNVIGETIEIPFVGNTVEFDLKSVSANVSANSPTISLDGAEYQIQQYDASTGTSSVVNVGTQYITTNGSVHVSIPIPASGNQMEYKIVNLTAPEGYKKANDVTFYVNPTAAVPDVIYRDLQNLQNASYDTTTKIFEIKHQRDTSSNFTNLQIILSLRDLVKGTPIANTEAANELSDIKYKIEVKQYENGTQIGTPIYTDESSSASGLINFKDLWVKQSSSATVEVKIINTQSSKSYLQKNYEIKTFEQNGSTFSANSNADITVDTTNNQSVKIEVYQTMKSKVNRLKLIATDTNGFPIEGLEYSVSTYEGDIVTQGQKTDNNGEISFNNFLPSNMKGTFIYTIVPKSENQYGLTLPSKLFSLKVDDNLNIIEAGESEKALKPINTVYTEKEIINEAKFEIEVDVPEIQGKNSLTIINKDKNTKKALTTSQFQVLFESETGEQKLALITSSGSYGTAVTKMPDWDTRKITIKQLSAPDGYRRDEETKVICVKNDNDTLVKLEDKVNNIPSGISDKDYSINGKDVLVNIFDGPMTELQVKFKIKLTDQFGTTILKDAYFHVEEEKTGFNHTYYTNENGNFYRSSGDEYTDPLVFSKEDDYAVTFTETTPPSGYRVPIEPFRMLISAREKDGIISIESEDTACQVLSGSNYQTSYKTTYNSQDNVLYIDWNIWNEETDTSSKKYYSVDIIRTDENGNITDATGAIYNLYSVNNANNVEGSRVNNSTPISANSIEFKHILKPTNDNGQDVIILSQSKAEDGYTKDTTAKSIGIKLQNGHVVYDENTTRNLIYNHNQLDFEVIDLNTDPQLQDYEVTPGYKEDVIIIKIKDKQLNPKQVDDVKSKFYIDFVKIVPDTKFSSEDRSNQYDENLTYDVKYSTSGMKDLNQGEVKFDGYTSDTGELKAIPLTKKTIVKLTEVVNENGTKMANPITQSIEIDYDEETKQFSLNSNSTQKGVSFVSDENDTLATTTSYTTPSSDSNQNPVLHVIIDNNAATFTLRLFNRRKGTYNWSTDHNAGDPADALQINESLYSVYSDNGSNTPSESIRRNQINQNSLQPGYLSYYQRRAVSMKDTTFIEAAGFKTLSQNETGSKTVTKVTMQQVDITRDSSGTEISRKNIKDPEVVYSETNSKQTGKSGTDSVFFYGDYKGKEYEVVMQEELTLFDYKSATYKNNKENPIKFLVKFDENGKVSRVINEFETDHTDPAVVIAGSESDDFVEDSDPYKYSVNKFTVRGMYYTQLLDSVKHNAGTTPLPNDTSSGDGASHAVTYAYPIDNLLGGGWYYWRDKYDRDNITYDDNDWLNIISDGTKIEGLKNDGSSQFATNNGSLKYVTGAQLTGTYSSPVGWWSYVVYGYRNFGNPPTRSWSIDWTQSNWTEKRPDTTGPIGYITMHSNGRNSDRNQMKQLIWDMLIGNSPVGDVGDQVVEDTNSGSNVMNSLAENAKRGSEIFNVPNYSDDKDDSKTSVYNTNAGIGKLKNDVVFGDREIDENGDGEADSYVGYKANWTDETIDFSLKDYTFSNKNIINIGILHDNIGEDHTKNNEDQRTNVKVKFEDADSEEKIEGATFKVDVIAAKDRKTYYTKDEINNSNELTTDSNKTEKHNFTAAGGTLQGTDSEGKLEFGLNYSYPGRTVLYELQVDNPGKVADSKCAGNYRIYTKDYLPTTLRFEITYDEDGYITAGNPKILDSGLSADEKEYLQKYIEVKAEQNSLDVEITIKEKIDSNFELHVEKKDSNGNPVQGIKFETQILSLDENNNESVNFHVSKTHETDANGETTILCKLETRPERIADDTKIKVILNELNVPTDMQSHGNIQLIVTFKNRTVYTCETVSSSNNENGEQFIVSTTPGATPSQTQQNQTSGSSSTTSIEISLQDPQIENNTKFDIHTIDVESSDEFDNAINLEGAEYDIRILKGGDDFFKKYPVETDIDTDVPTIPASDANGKTTFTTNHTFAYTDTLDKSYKYGTSTTFANGDHKNGVVYEITQTKSADGYQANNKMYVEVIYGWDGKIYYVNCFTEITPANIQNTNQNATIAMNQLVSVSANGQMYNEIKLEDNYVIPAEGTSELKLVVRNEIAPKYKINLSKKDIRKDDLVKDESNNILKTQFEVTAYERKVDGTYDLNDEYDYTVSAPTNDSGKTFAGFKKEVAGKILLYKVQEPKYILKGSPMSQTKEKIATIDRGYIEVKFDADGDADIMQLAKVDSTDPSKATAVVLPTVEENRGSNYLNVLNDGLHTKETSLEIRVKTFQFKIICAPNNQAPYKTDGMKYTVKAKFPDSTDYFCTQISEPTTTISNGKSSSIIYYMDEIYRNQKISLEFTQNTTTIDYREQQDVSFDVTFDDRGYPYVNPNQKTDSNHQLLYKVEGSASYGGVNDSVITNYDRKDNVQNLDDDNYLIVNLYQNAKQRQKLSLRLDDQVSEAISGTGPISGAQYILTATNIPSSSTLIDKPMEASTDSTGYVTFDIAPNVGFNHKVTYTLIQKSTDDDNKHIKTEEITKIEVEYDSNSGEGVAGRILSVKLVGEDDDPYMDVTSDLTISKDSGKDGKKPIIVTLRTKNKRKTTFTIENEDYYNSDNKIEGSAFTIEPVGSIDYSTYNNSTTQRYVSQVSPSNSTSDTLMEFTKNYTEIKTVTYTMEYPQYPNGTASTSPYGTAPTSQLDTYLGYNGKTLKFSDSDPKLADRHNGATSGNETEVDQFKYVPDQSGVKHIVLYLTKESDDNWNYRPQTDQYGNITNKHDTNPLRISSSGGTYSPYSGQTVGGNYDIYPIAYQEIDSNGTSPTEQKVSSTANYDLLYSIHDITIVNTDGDLKLTHKVTYVQTAKYIDQGTTDADGKIVLHPGPEFNNTTVIYKLTQTNQNANEKKKYESILDTINDYDDGTFAKEYDSNGNASPNPGAIYFQVTYNNSYNAMVIGTKVLGFMKKDGTFAKISNNSDPLPSAGFKVEVTPDTSIDSYGVKIIVKSEPKLKVKFTPVENTTNNPMDSPNGKYRYQLYDLGGANNATALFTPTTQNASEYFTPTNANGDVLNNRTATYITRSDSSWPSGTTTSSYEYYEWKHEVASDDGVISPKAPQTASGTSTIKKRLAIFEDVAPDGCHSKKLATANSNIPIACFDIEFDESGQIIGTPQATPNLSTVIQTTQNDVRIKTGQSSDDTHNSGHDIDIEISYELTKEFNIHLYNYESINGGNLVTYTDASGNQQGVPFKVTINKGTEVSWNTGDPNDPTKNILDPSMPTTVSINPNDINPCVNIKTDNILESNSVYAITIEQNKDLLSSDLDQVKPIRFDLHTNKNGGINSFDANGKDVDSNYVIEDYFTKQNYSNNYTQIIMDNTPSYTVALIYTNEYNIDIIVINKKRIQIVIRDMDAGEKGTTGSVVLYSKIKDITESLVGEDGKSLNGTTPETLPRSATTGTCEGTTMQLDNGNVALDSSGNIDTNKDHWLIDNVIPYKGNSPINGRRGVTSDGSSAQKWVRYTIKQDSSVKIKAYDRAGGISSNAEYSYLTKLSETDIDPVAYIDVRYATDGRPLEAKVSSSKTEASVELHDLNNDGINDQIEIIIYNKSTFSVSADVADEYNHTHLADTEMKLVEVPVNFSQTSSTTTDYGDKNDYIKILNSEGVSKENISGNIQVFDNIMSDSVNGNAEFKNTNPDETPIANPAQGNDRIKTFYLLKIKKLTDGYTRIHNEETSTKYADLSDDKKFDALITVEFDANGKVKPNSISVKFYDGGNNFDLAPTYMSNFVKATTDATCNSLKITINLLPKLKMTVIRENLADKTAIKDMKIALRRVVNTSGSGYSSNNYDTYCVTASSRGKAVYETNYISSNNTSTSSSSTSNDDQKNTNNAGFGEINITTSSSSSSNSFDDDNLLHDDNGNHTTSLNGIISAKDVGPINISNNPTEYLIQDVTQDVRRYSSGHIHFNIREFNSDGTIPTLNNTVQYDQSSNVSYYDVDSSKVSVLGNTQQKSYIKLGVDINDPRRLVVIFYDMKQVRANIKIADALNGEETSGVGTSGSSTKIYEEFRISYVAPDRTQVDLFEPNKWLSAKDLIGNNSNNNNLNWIQKLGRTYPGQTIIYTIKQRKYDINGNEDNINGKYSKNHAYFAMDDLQMSISYDANGDIDTLAPNSGISFSNSSYASVRQVVKNPSASEQDANFILTLKLEPVLWIRLDAIEGLYPATNSTSSNNKIDNLTFKIEQVNETTNNSGDRTTYVGKVYKETWTNPQTEHGAVMLPLHIHGINPTNSNNTIQYKLTQSGTDQGYEQISPITFEITFNGSGFPTGSSSSGLTEIAQYRQSLRSKNIRGLNFQISMHKSIGIGFVAIDSQDQTTNVSGVKFTLQEYEIDGNGNVISSKPEDTSITQTDNNGETKVSQSNTRSTNDAKGKTIRYVVRNTYVPVAQSFRKVSSFYFDVPYTASGFVGIIDKIKAYRWDDATNTPKTTVAENAIIIPAVNPAVRSTGVLPGTTAGYVKMPSEGNSTRGSLVLRIDVKIRKGYSIKIIDHDGDDRIINNPIRDYKVSGTKVKISLYVKNGASFVFPTTSDIEIATSDYIIDSQGNITKPNGDLFETNSYGEIELPNIMFKEDKEYWLQINTDADNSNNGYSASRKYDIFFKINTSKYIVMDSTSNDDSINDGKPDVDNNIGEIQVDILQYGRYKAKFNFIDWEDHDVANQSDRIDYGAIGTLKYQINADNNPNESTEDIVNNEPIAGEIKDVADSDHDGTIDYEITGDDYRKLWGHTVVFTFEETTAPQHQDASTGIVTKKAKISRIRYYANFNAIGHSNEGNIDTLTSPKIYTILDSSGRQTTYADNKRIDGGVIYVDNNDRGTVATIKSNKILTTEEQTDLDLPTISPDMGKYYLEIIDRTRKQEKEANLSLSNSNVAISGQSGEKYYIEFQTKDASGNYVADQDPTYSQLTKTTNSEGKIESTYENGTHQNMQIDNNNFVGEKRVVVKREKQVQTQNNSSSGGNNTNSIGGGTSSGGNTITGNNTTTGGSSSSSATTQIEYETEISMDYEIAYTNNGVPDIIITPTGTDISKAKTQDGYITMSISYDLVTRTITVKTIEIHTINVTVKDLRESNGTSVSVGGVEYKLSITTTNSSTPVQITDDNGNDTFVTDTNEYLPNGFTTNPNHGAFTTKVPVDEGESATLAILQDPNRKRIGFDSIEAQTIIPIESDSTISQTIYDENYVSNVSLRPTPEGYIRVKRNGDTDYYVEIIDKIDLSRTKHIQVRVGIADAYEPDRLIEGGIMQFNTVEENSGKMGLARQVTSTANFDSTTTFDDYAIGNLEYMVQVAGVDGYIEEKTGEQHKVKVIVNEDGTVNLDTSQFNASILKDQSKLEKYCYYEELPNGITRVTIKVPYQSVGAKFIIHNVDSAYKNNLIGAQFELKDEYNDPNANNGKIKTTNPDGEAVFILPEEKNLQDETFTYTIRQKTSISGYSKDSAKYTIKLKYDKDGNVDVSSITDTQKILVSQKTSEKVIYVEIGNNYQGTVAPFTLKIMDYDATDSSKSIQGTKYIIGGLVPADAGKELEDVDGSINYPSSEAVTDEKGIVVTNKDAKTDENKYPKLYISGNGCEVVIKQYEAGAGYQNNLQYVNTDGDYVNAIRIKLNRSPQTGKIEILDDFNGMAKLEENSDGTQTLVVTDTNKPLMNKLSLVVNKADINGDNITIDRGGHAKYQINITTSAEDGTETSLLSDEYETDDDGIIKVKAVDIENLSDVKIALKETQSPTGYNLNSNELVINAPIVYNGVENIPDSSRVEKSENTSSKDVSVANVNKGVITLDVFDVGKDDALYFEPTDASGYSKKNADKKYIVSVQPQTSVTDFMKNIDTNATSVTIEKPKSIKDPTLTEITGDTIVGTMTRITAKKGEQTEEYYIVVMEDGTYDGKVTFGDLTRLIGFLKANGAKPTQEDLYAYDFGGKGPDGKLGFGDMTKLVNILNSKK